MPPFPKFVGAGGFALIFAVKFLWQFRFTPSNSNQWMSSIQGISNSRQPAMEPECYISAASGALQGVH